MTKFYEVIGIFVWVFLLTGCTALVDMSQKPNIKQDLLKGVDGNLSKISTYNDNNLYEEENIKIEELSSYVTNSGASNIQEISNVSNPIRRNKTFNSDLQVISKQFDNKKVKIAIEEMPLNKFLHLVFGKVLNVDYVLDKSVQSNKEPVSINLKKELSKKDLFKVVSNMLEEFKVIIDIEKGIFYLKNATRSPAESVYKIYLGQKIPKGLDDQQIIYMMRPYFYNKYLNKYNVFVKDYFLSKKGSIELDRFEHIIKIKDKVANIKKALAFYDFVDQPTLRNKNMKLIRMNHMEVTDFLKDLKPIISNYGIPISDKLRSSGVQFVPIKQINAFLLLSDKEEWTQTVIFWKKKLDVEKESLAEQQFFVYAPRNRRADELVAIINKFQDAYIDKDNIPNIAQTSNKVPLERSTDPQNNTIDILGKGRKVQVVLDKERNNIIIHGTKVEYLNIVKMLRKLDTLPKQVLIEVTIAEITLRDSMQFGLEWFIKTRGSNYGLTLSALGAGSSGVAGVLSAVSGDFGLNFNALQTNKYVNVLSNPKLLVLNNHDASINIGNQVPVVSSQATAADLGGGGGQPSLLQNIQYRNTGIQLTVKPTINSEGYLTLSISQNVSNAQANDTSDISSPLIFNRSIQTEVILKSGEMVLLGGLMTENKSRDETKIPFLGSIPILGRLFSTDGDSIDKTELAIMVKPTIISTHQDAKIITEALLNLIHFN